VDPFRVGDRVTIRFGERQGQHGQIVERQPAEVYKVRLPDGTALFFSRQSLLCEAVEPSTRLPAPWGASSRN
jgi:hypothetical protein